MSSSLGILSSASLLVLATAAPAAAQEQGEADLPGQQRQETLGASDQAEPSEVTNQIIVTGVRAAIIGGLENKREATQIIESVVAEDIGKLPDNNVIEVLQRVAGVQVTNRARGEASAILIRGLPDVVTTMNGRNIFTASGRAFALQDVPATLVNRIDVYKTRAAEQIETGIAGQVNVFSRRPLDFDGFVASAIGRVIYNEQAESFNPNVTGLLSNTWDTGAGEFGVLVSGSYNTYEYREMAVGAGAMVPFVTENPPAGTGFTPLQRVFPETGAWTPGLDRGLSAEPGSTFTLNGVQTPYYLARDALFLPDLHGQRDRAAVSAAVQWAPNSSSQYTFEFFWNRYEEEIQNNLLFTFVDWWGALGPNPGSTFELFEGTNIIKSRTAGNVFGFNSGDFTKSRTDSFVYAFNADWDIGDSTGVTLDLSHQNSEFNTLFLANRITRVAPQVTYDTNPGNMIPSLSFGNNALLFDPSAWTLGEFYDNANRSEGDAWTGHLDAAHEFDEGFVDTIKVGVRYDDRGASDLIRTQDAPGLGRPFSSLDQSYIFTGSRYFNGRANVPSRWISPRGRTIYENADDYRRLYQSVDPLLQLSDELELVRVFDITEVSKAAYIQVDTEFQVFGRPLYLQYGVRYVDVDTDLTFTDRITGEVLSDSQNTSDFLPSATVRLDITDTVRLRFNYGETLRRPTFPNLNPFLQLTGDLTNIGRGSGTGGNANLQPTTSKNYDLGAEWYFSPGSALYATLFRREIEGLVVPFTSVIDFPTDPLGEGTTRSAITRPENASDGTLEGIEVGFTYFPEFLPGLLDGLGVQGSLTVLDSLQNIPQTDSAGNVIGQDESPFFGVSDFSYNVTLAYDSSGLGLRLSYVWRDEFLSANEARLFANPIGFWRTPEESLDFQLTYALTDRFGVTFDAVNLTNDVQQQYYRFGDVGNPEQFNTTTTLLPRTFAFGMRYTFE